MPTPASKPAAAPPAKEEKKAPPSLNEIAARQPKKYGLQRVSNLRKVRSA